MAKTSQSRKDIQQKADSKRAGKRARAWTAMVYQESALPEWLDKLSEQLIEALVSPLHDKDVWSVEDEQENASHVAGEPKKAHWHVVISFKNPATYDKAKEVFDGIGAVTPPEIKCKVKDFRQMARYLCHLDQPRKHRYNEKDVLCFGAVDYASLVMSGTDEDDMLDDIFDFIRANHFFSFVEFQCYVKQCRPDWRKLVYHQYSAIITRFIKSLVWESEHGYVSRDFSDSSVVLVNPATGEPYELNSNMSEDNSDI